jgi:hypothetical protein
MVADLVDWSSLENIPAGLADGTDNDSLSELTCADSQTLTFIGGSASWACADLVAGPAGPQGPQGADGPAGPPGPGLDLLRGFSCPSVGVPCDDGNICTFNDTAIGGVYGFDAAGTPLCGTFGVGCQGQPVDCNDGNQCTTDSCNPSTGCVNIANTAPCSDGDACTTGDMCNGGACLPGMPVNCDDGNICTNDSCNPATGCQFTFNTSPCDDGDPGTTGDTCSMGVCMGS